MSTGHGSLARAGESVSASCAPDTVSPTALPAGTAPGCQVTVADPSAVTTAPAWPGCAVAESATGAGTGAARTTAVGDEVAVWAPAPLVAVTNTSIVAPRSPGLST